MPILIRERGIQRGVCWECGLSFSDDRPVIFWDALSPVMLHSACALAVGQRLLRDAHESMELEGATMES